MLRIQKIIKGLLITGMAVMTWVSLAVAGDLAKPNGQVILTVYGQVSTTNSTHGAQFDKAMLEGLGIQVVETKTPWTEGKVTFEGPLVRDVLKAVGAQGGELSAIALNDYAAKIPTADFQEYDVILALKMNGKYMSVRNKGPIFIVYPFDRHEELNSERIYSRSVWQLKALKVY